MNIILFDTEARTKLFPLTLTRAVADLRMGILTIKERWAMLTGAKVFVLTDFYLQPLYELPAAGEYTFIDAGIIPTPDLVSIITQLGADTAILDENGLIAGRTVVDFIPATHKLKHLFTNATPVPTVKRLSFPFHLFQWNQELIELDFLLVTKGRSSGDADDTVHLRNPAEIFIEDEAEVSYSVLNASTGPIYIGKNAIVMEGCHIRGPFALCEGAVLKMGTRIYGATTMGPYSMGGGEIKNSIITGYSNKAHDGYLGDSVIGEWCNLGAGTSNSNVKNTGALVNLWNYQAQEFLPAGNKCGVIMGDYSRTAINSSINTGSVIGVSCNVFGSGLLPKYIPDFSWGCNAATRYGLPKAVKDLDNWKKMKNKNVTEQETQVLKHIFELSHQE